jgi:hypothetical protein
VRSSFDAGLVRASLFVNAFCIDIRDTAILVVQQSGWSKPVQSGAFIANHTAEHALAA